MSSPDLTGGSIVVKKAMDSCFRRNDRYIQYMQFAIFGIHPELSKAEIQSVTKTPLINFGTEGAIFESNINLKKLQKQLGGTQKTGEIISSIDNAQTLENELLRHLLKINNQGKLQFGISVYDVGGTSYSKNLRRENKKLGLTLKKSLKEAGQSARLVTSTEPTLSSVVVAKNKLTENGIEICLLVTQNKIFIGQTKTVQDFDDWSHRDYNRPRRNAKNGMLPPKLARMMINLGSLPTDRAAILDPFCGSGTILMEAAVLRFAKIIGSDIDEKIIEDSADNLHWLEETGIKTDGIELFVSPASELQLDKQVDCIVTEPYLGKPRNGRESETQIQEQVRELETLYASCFTNLKKLMKPDAILVLASPVHKIKKMEFSLDIETIFEKIGLLKTIGPLRYERENQFVGRDIWVFKHPL